MAVGEFIDGPLGMMITSATGSEFHFWVVQLRDLRNRNCYHDIRKAVESCLLKVKGRRNTKKFDRCRKTNTASERIRRFLIRVFLVRVFIAVGQKCSTASDRAVSLSGLSD